MSVSDAGRLPGSDSAFESRAGNGATGLRWWKRISAFVRDSPIVGFSAVTLGTIAAVVVGAGLLYDGSWFFLNAVSTGNVLVPQNRLTFAVLTWPTAFATQHIQSVGVLLTIYTLSLAITPVVAFAASWWITRRWAPSLLIWPVLGVLLINLPGQMDWIATSIRTNQLLWPVLLAVLCGLPYGSLPIVVVFTFLAVNLHPQAAPLLVFLAVAALLVAWRDRAARPRLLIAAPIFVLLGAYRYVLIQGTYAAGESSFSNQMSQWKSAVWGWPLVLVGATVIAGAAVAFAPRRFLSRRGGASSLAYLPAVLLVVALPFMVRWATDPAQWRTVVNYRGPSFWHTLILMTLAVIDRLRAGSGAVVLQRPRSVARSAIVNVAGCVFGIVILAQCLSFHGQRAQLETAIAAAPTTCIPASTIPGFASNPLDFWTLPATSLMVQSKTPTHLVLPGNLCAQARSNGQPIFATIPEAAPAPTHMNFSTLSAGLAAERPCRVDLGHEWLQASGMNAPAALIEPGKSVEIDVDVAAPGTLGLGITVAGNGPIPISATLDGTQPMRLAFVPGHSGQLEADQSVDGGKHRISMTNTTAAPLLVLAPTLSLVESGVACPPS